MPVFIVMPKYRYFRKVYLMLQGIKQKVSSALDYVKLYWKKPPTGKYVSLKEVINYGVGGIGVQFIIYFSSLIALTSSSLLVGNTIGIQPVHLQIMSVISTVIGFGITILKSYLIDTVNFKMGKFKPWLAFTALPTVILSIVFVWLPYETMSYSSKVISVFICYNLLMLFYPFYTESYNNVANVISPDSNERTDIVSITSIIYSIAPSIANFIIPILSKFTGGLNSITTYRIIHPSLALLGIILTGFTVFGVKERIVQAVSHEHNFSFVRAVKAVSKNKYFWINSTAGWLGFLETAVYVILAWTFVYGYPDRMGTYSLATTLIGNAAFWAMMLAPIAIRKLGKRNLLIWCNLANVFLIAALYPTYKNIYWLIALYYLNHGFINSFSIVYNIGISADIRDYQQYITGERIDGMFGTVGLIGSFIGMFTGMVLPMIYESLGLVDNYDVLEVASFRYEMSEVLIIASVIGSALNVVPYFFYDLTETKHKGIIGVLKIRAMLEDYGNGVINNATLVEAVEIINAAKENIKKKDEILTKEYIKIISKQKARSEAEIKAKERNIAQLKQKLKENKAVFKQEKKNIISTAKSREEKKALLSELKQRKKENSLLQKRIIEAVYVIDEIEKFQRPRMQSKLMRAKKITEAGIAGLYNTPDTVLQEARALPAYTVEEREIRSDAISEAKQLLSCKKLLHKKFPGGITPVSQEEKNAVEAMPEDSFTQALKKKIALRNLDKKEDLYKKATMALHNAQMVEREYYNQSHFDELLSKYEEAKAALEQEQAQKQALEEEEKQRKLAEIERQKAEKLEAKSRRNK
ncbi:MAG: hypothetical protein GX264_01540 [Clostridiales bacterium]|jgi:Na+/melibiose symporter-like transporter|nr:hypothetical protein [Clostridiales bacterium]